MVPKQAERLTPLYALRSTPKPNSEPPPPLTPPHKGEGKTATVALPGGDKDKKPQE